MAEEKIIYVRKNANHEWVVGVPVDQVTIPNVTDKKALKSFSFSRSITAKHEKDADDITRLSVYSDKSSTGSVNMCYTKGQKPEPGEAIVFTDDAGKVRKLQITSVGTEYSSTSTCAMCNVSFEHFDGWEDDAAAE